MTCRPLFLGVTIGPDEHLSGMTSLKALSLPATRITDQGLAKLHKLTELTELFVKGTGLTAGGVKKLQAALPKCKIVWDGDTPAKK